MSDIVILVARRRDYGQRDYIWNHVRNCWVTNFPTYVIHEGYHETDEPFNRSIALNKAAEEAGDWKIALIIDADVLIDNVNQIYEAVRVASRGRLAAAFNVRKHLSRDGTDAALANVPFGWNLHVTLNERTSVSGALAINRELWDRVHGFDDNFVGFGYEDWAFVVACEVMSERKIYQVEGILWHLWHEKSPEDNPESPGLLRNRERWLRYLTLQYSRSEFEELLVE